MVAKRAATAILLVLASGALFAGQVTPSTGRDVAWLEDLDIFTREFAARQLDFAKLYPRAQFDAAIDEIRRDLPRTSDADVVLSLMRVVAGARVAHTLVRPPSSGRLAFRRLPLAVTWYGSDLAVTGAAEPIAPRSASASCASAGSRLSIWSAPSTARSWTCD